jgi:hypothetical protein
MAVMATWIERFERGDYPMVCARSGLPADKLVPVEAARRASWPWWFLPINAIAWLLMWRSVDKDRLWGHLPFATGHVEGVTATWDQQEGVVLLRGVNPVFVEACHEHQARMQADQRP